MSRKSEHSKAGSEGNGDSPLPSYQSSPRKTSEFGTAGPFGDHCTENKTNSCYIFMMNDDSSSDLEEDQEANDLKAEYLERLSLIRQKLANIDIANCESYYKNCYGYSSGCSPPGCQITEIFDDSPKEGENIDSIINNVTTTDLLKINDSSYKEKNISKIQAIRDNAVKNYACVEETERKYTNEESIINGNFISTSKSEAELDTQHSNIEDNTNIDAKNSEQFELKTIFKCENSYNAESTMELIDLNYNPPKKKHCVRESTPKIIMSDGAMSLPYHIRVSLHSEILKSNNQEQIEDIANTSKLTDTDNTEQIPVSDEKSIEEKNNHIFPDIQVDCFGGGDQEKSIIEPAERTNTLLKEKAVNSPRISSNGDSEYKVFFFDVYEQTPSNSARSNRTVISETTITTDSPSRKPKRRRILLRSARNKVNPIDRISLWDEIRTMEALKKKQEASSSSLESYFKDVIAYRNEHESYVDLASVGSLDIPRKTKPTSRFPSITRITKFCSSIFRKKSKTIVEDIAGEDDESARNSNRDLKNKSKTRPKQLLKTPKAANMLLKVRKEQDFDVDVGYHTPLDENRSEYSYVEDEDDSYYDGLCSICFCF